MKSRATLLTLIPIILATLLLSACSSSSNPEARIRNNPEYFAALPPDTQSRIRAGIVQVGDTPEIVYLALGRPDRQYTRTISGAATLIWAYEETVSTGSNTNVSVGMGMRRSGGSSSRSTSLGVSTGGNNNSRRTFDRIRVFFTNGQVTSIETRSF